MNIKKYLDNEIKRTILKHAIMNALEYQGKANPGAIVGRLINEFPNVKKDVKSHMKIINEIVQFVNKIKNSEKEEILRQNFSTKETIKKKQKKKEGLKELDNVKKGVIMRFAPSPSGPMHIGHAITGGLTSLYVKKYSGKFILRIEDTNSDKIDPIAYKQLPKDAEWIFGNVTDVWIQSDRMEIYYKYIKKLINLNAIYVCECSQAEFKKYSLEMKECPCRNVDKKETKLKWKKMFKGYKEGEAVIRFKSNMKDKNPAMRDFPLVRINESKHPRQGKKYRVWPLMNLCVTVDDIEAKMTHIIRAKDHHDNAKRQEMIYKVLKKKYPETYFTGRYNFEGLEISCSKTKERIKAGHFTGWDDIRIPFLQALKRRGYQAEAFLKYTELTGLSLTDKTVSGNEFFKTINAFNKDIIDPKAKRLFFLHDYELVKIKGAPRQKLKLLLHPDNPKLGTREIKTHDKFYIQSSDLKQLKKGQLYRLMDCLNFKLTKNGFEFDSLEYKKYKDKGKKIMHFLPVSTNNVKVEVLMPDASVLKGLAEKTVDKVKVGEVIQFERFGFCRRDQKNKFWFTHK